MLFTPVCTVCYRKICPPHFINCFLLPTKRRLLFPTTFSLECFKFLFWSLTAKFYCIQHSSRRGTWFRTVNMQDILFSVFFMTKFSIFSIILATVVSKRKHSNVYSISYVLGLFLKTQCPLKSSTAYSRLYPYITIFLL